jgi:hypothetical protein
MVRVIVWSYPPMNRWRLIHRWQQFKQGAIV